MLPPQWGHVKDALALCDALVAERAAHAETKRVLRELLAACCTVRGLLPAALATAAEKAVAQPGHDLF